MSPNLRAAILSALTLPLFAGCGTLRTGHRDLDRSFNGAQTATERPAQCFVISGLAAAFGWLWFTQGGNVEYDANAPKGERFTPTIDSDTGSHSFNDVTE